MRDVQHQLLPAVVPGVHSGGRAKTISLHENHRGKAVRIAKSDDFAFAKVTGFFVILTLYSDLSLLITAGTS